MTNRLGSAWITSLIAVLGSLYFSEVAGFIPCELCWYQRILMYPLAIILGVGIYANDKRIPVYVLPFSIIGVFLSAFHYLHQKTEWFAQTMQCTQGVSCSGEYINWLGFITIPSLSFVAFLIITFLMIGQLKRVR